MKANVWFAAAVDDWSAWDKGISFYKSDLIQTRILSSHVMRDLFFSLHAVSYMTLDLSDTVCNIPTMDWLRNAGTVDQYYEY